MFRSMLRLNSLHAILVLMVVLAGVVSNSQAAIITYQTSVGAKSSDLPVNAWAEFTTGTNQITVVLHNGIVDPKSVGQNLSGLTFTVSSGQNAGTLTSSYGIERTVVSGGAYTEGGSASTGWALKTVGSQLQLTVLGTPEAPQHTIIGLPNAISGEYDNANASIAKTGGSHNPFLDQSATFVLNVQGVTANSGISAATFSFNTAAGYDVTGVPEPMTLGLLTAGGVMLLLRRRRK